MDQAEKTLSDIDDAIRVMQGGYYLWFAIHIILGSLSIILPGIAAIGFFDEIAAKFLAAGGALSAALVQFLKPHEYATGYDLAVQLAWKTHIAFNSRTIDTNIAIEQINKAIDATTFRYGIHQGTR